MALCDPYKVEPIWEGQTVVIVGSGPSLSLQQIRTVAIARAEKHCRVIAVNDAIYPCFWADWLHAGDLKWWRWHIHRINDFTGIRTTVSDDVPGPWVNGYLEYSGDLGFDPDSSKCKSGGSSAYQAACIAVHTGAKRIILLGIDMKRGPDGQVHWFGEHPERTTVNYAVAMAPKWDTLKPTLEERSIEVINCSPGTALETFPLGDIEKIFPHA